LRLLCTTALANERRSPRLGVSVKLAYPSMTVDEIKALRVADVAQDDAHLYLWTTNGYLPAAFDVAKAWGFQYSTTLVWAKNLMGGGLGGAFGISTEFLPVLQARLAAARARKHEGTWFDFKRPMTSAASRCTRPSQPSSTPSIEGVSPGPFLEMFARKNRLGWDAWGNECLSVDLPFVMLNPSTADAMNDDPTIRRCIGYARTLGCARLEVVNLFAYRSTSPDVLYALGRMQAIGPDNDRHILEACKGARLVLCAWGNHGTNFGRANEVLLMLRANGAKPMALKINRKSGQPAHPLYLKGDARPMEIA
jgi:hypothetical protein